MWKPDLDSLLSARAIPPADMADRRQFRSWLNWFEQAEHPDYRPPWATAVRYEVNSAGYRCDELDEPKGLRLLTVGCSFTFGTAIPYEATFSFRLARMLEAELASPVTNWNLSSPGKGADYIGRVVSASVPQLRPHLVVVLFSFLARREHITETGRLLGYNPGTPKDAIRHVMPPEARDVYAAFDNLASQPDDNRNFVLNFRLCRLTIERYRVPWCFSTIEPEASETITQLDWSEDHIGDFLKRDALALDRAHPGPEANERFASSIFRHLEGSGKLALLADQARKL